MIRKLFKSQVVIGLAIALMTISIPSLASGVGPAPSDASLAGKTIHLALTSFPGVPEIIRRVPEFEKETGIKVDIEMLSFGPLVNKNTIDLAFGTGIYDAVLFIIPFGAAYAKNKMILPLNQFVEGEDKSHLDRLRMEDIIPKALEVNSYDGKIYGLPFYCESSGLFYRKDLFAEAGIAEASTLEDIWNAAEKLTKKPDLYGIVMRGLKGDAVYTWGSWLRAYGGEYFDENMKPILDSPEAIASVKAYADILKEYGPPGQASFDWSQVRNYAAKGKTAQFYDCTAFTTMIEDPGSETRGKWDMVLPNKIKGPGGYLAPTIGTWAFGISAYSSVPWATWRFISWVASYEMSQNLMEEGFMFSGEIFRKSQTEEHPEIAKTYWAQKTSEALAAAPLEYRPRIRVWPEVEEVVGTALSSVIASEKPASEAMKAANEEIYKIMERAGYYK